MGWITIVGAGPGNPAFLTLRAREVLEGAEVVVCRRDLAGCLPCSLKVVPLQGGTAEMLQTLQSLCREYREVVVLLSGDPMLFSLLKHLPREWIREIIPGVSVFQYFSSRLGIVEDDLVFLNLHAQEDFSEFRLVLEEGRGGLVLSGDCRRTEEVLILIEGLRPESEVAVGADLSLPEERILKGSPENVRKQLGGNRFHVVYFPPATPSGVAFLEDREFIQEGTHLTKKENRMFIVSALELSPGMQVLEVGSGSGGVTIEIARRIGKGRVFAVERDAASCTVLRENLGRLGVLNVHLIEGEAPEAIPQEWYHRVFVGGSGGRLAAILERVSLLVVKGGIVAFVAVTLETLEEGVRVMEGMPFVDLHVVEQSVTRFEKRGRWRMAHSLNSIFLVWGRRRG